MRWDPAANKVSPGRSLHSIFQTSVCAPQTEGFPAFGAAVELSSLVLPLSRHPLRATSGHSQREALGQAAGRVPLRHLRDVHLQPRLPAARGALHPLHHPRRQERRVERAPAGVRRWGWAGCGCRDPQQSSQHCCFVLGKTGKLQPAGILASGFSGPEVQLRPGRVGEAGGSPRCPRILFPLRDV